MDSTNQQLSNEEYQAVTQHLDHLVQQFEKLPLPEVQEKVFEMLQAIDALHRESLSRLIGFLRQNGQAGMIDRAAADPVIATLLVLYDLAPGHPVIQADRALEAIRPYIHSHGGEVEVLDVRDGIVHLRLSGACHGCAGSAITLQRGIEAALRQDLPGYKGMEVHEPEREMGVARPDGLITFDRIQPVIPASPDEPAETMAPRSPHRLNAPVFQVVSQIDDLPPGSVRPAALVNRNLLLANIDGEIYAIGAECPGSDFPLTYGELDGARLTCPWHDEVFDVRTGKRLDEPDGEEMKRLPIYPVAITGKEVMVAINVAPQPMHSQASGERSG